MNWRLISLIQQTYPLHKVPLRTKKLFFLAMISMFVKITAMLISFIFHFKINTVI